MTTQQLRTIQQDFLQELQNAAQGKKTSVPFIKHTLSTKLLVQEQEIFQVIAIGGSVFKKARIKKLNNTLVVLSQSKENQPVFRSIHDLSTFLMPHLDSTAQTIGVNFAYPMTPVLQEDTLDGVLRNGSKENTFDGLIGKPVGRYIAELYKQTFNKPVRVSCANDTICLLFSGLTQYPADTLAAGIVVTGTNFAFFLTSDTAINLESANFSRFPLSAAAASIDAKSTTPGTALFEKETAGAYLYKHYNLWREKHKHAYPLLASTHALKLLALDTKNPQSATAQIFLRHSASLIACQIAAIAAFKQRPMIFVMEGSLFWGEDIYKQYVEEYLTLLAPKEPISLVKIPESTILGAAKLVA